MTLRHLHVFITVVREKSITAAAEKLFISQPAVSTAVRELEEHFGVRLFDRVSRKLCITAHGEEFYDHAVRIVREYQALEEHFSGNGARKKLRVGCGIAVGKLIMPALAREFTLAHGEIDLKVLVNNSQTIEAMLEKLELELGIMESIAVQTGNLERLVLQVNPLAVICHKDSPLAKLRYVTVEDLAREKLLLREKNSDTRDAVEKVFSRHNIQVKPAWESVSAMALINAVGQGLGISILPLNYVTELQHDNIVVLEVDGFRLERFIHIVYHKKRNISDEALLFIEFCQEYVKRKRGTGEQEVKTPAASFGAAGVFDSVHWQGLENRI